MFKKEIDIKQRNKNKVNKYLVCIYISLTGKYLIIKWSLFRKGYFYNNYNKYNKYNLYNTTLVRNYLCPGYIQVYCNQNSQLTSSAGFSIRNQILISTNLNQVLYRLYCIKKSIWIHFLLLVLDLYILQEK